MNSGHLKEEFTLYITGYADLPKRAAIEQRGFTLRKNWLVKPLP